MKHRISDPSSRRLRNFVLLVIFAVALPSLLLTGFGLIAIDNERAVAVKRLHELYEPILKKVATRMNEILASLPKESEQPLEQLAAWARREVSRPGEAFVNFSSKYRFAVNYFVLDRQGKVLVPRDEPPLPSWLGYLPKKYLRGLRLEFIKKDPESASKAYRDLLTRQQRADPTECLVLNAYARSTKKEGCPEESLKALGRLAGSCPDFVDSSGYNLALGARIERLELLHPADPPLLIEEANALADQLTDPMLEASRTQVDFVARRAHALLKSVGDPSLAPAAARLEEVTKQDAFLKTVAGLTGRLGAQPALEVQLVDGRREVMILRGGDQPAGFSLAPSAFDSLLREYLDELEVDENLHAYVLPAKECCPAEMGLGALAGSAFLKDTDLAWRLDLLLSGSEALERLTQSRARLYLWALLLLVAALLLGIARTLQVMVRETKLSRLKTDFVSCVSHELRTPLTSIRMFTETLLLERVKSKPEEHECLETIGQETERLSRLVERILDFSRMEAGRKAYCFRPERVPELVDSAVAACRPMIEKGGFEIQRQLPAGLPELVVDRDAMVEVLINLLSNAFKYSPKERKVEILARPNGDYLELSVRDQGIGIPRSEQKRIFEKFYRVDTPLASQVSGSGLGLSLVQYIVRAHQGEIRLESSPGQGSTFTVRLPLRPRDESQPPDRHRNPKGKRELG